MELTLGRLCPRSVPSFINAGLKIREIEAQPDGRCGRAALEHRAEQPTFVSRREARRWWAESKLQQQSRLGRRDGRPYFTMSRKHNTDSRGGGFLPVVIEAVWQKAKVIPGYPNYRTDTCGALIARNEYGLTTKHGWEIDHEKPVASRGGDELSNLQPLQWENNRHKSDSWPLWTCKVRT